MPTFENYGQAIAATTSALQQLLASAAVQATARPPDAARHGVSGTSVNLFLYRDDLARYRSGNDPREADRILVELHYLVSTHPGDDADTDAESQRAYGAARSAIERHPVLTVPDGTGGSFTVRVTNESLTLEDRTKLWLAACAALRLSFELAVSFALDTPVRTSGAIGTVDNVVELEPGSVAVFGGVDAGAKAAAAIFVAQQRGEFLITVPLADVVSKYIGETEPNLQALFSGAGENAGENTGANTGANGTVLFLDEADALFGRRTDVRDAHDRYANIDAGVVLDRLTGRTGLVIIALTGPVGVELERRADVHVHFPPD
ncbi:MAG: Pvc16 family protein [Terrimesophilobacter sp.]